MRLITKSAMLDTPHTAALDPRLYVDPASLDREQEAIFARTWQLGGHASAVAEPGRFMTVRTGRESALVIRGEDGELRAFRNVCRHRAARLREGSGDCGKALRCPYHGWTYRTDGRLIGVPEGRGFPGLDKTQLGLMPASVEIFHGLVFVNLDPGAAPLAPTLDGLGEKLAPYGIERLEPFGDFQPSSQPANWKIVADNYLEGYHVPIAHPSLMRLLDYQSYTVEVGEGYVWFEAPLRKQAVGQPARARVPEVRAPDGGPDRGRPRRLALRLHLAEHDDRLLPRPGHDLAAQPERDRRDPRRLGLLPRRRPEPRDARDPAAQPPAQHGGRRRGRRARRPRAGGDGHDGLDPRPAGRARGRSGVVRLARPRGAGGRRVTAPPRTAPDARGRILEAACDVIAEQGIDDVRIARIATLAGVSPPLVHYHFATREALLGEALEHSFELLGDLRTTSADDDGWTAGRRLAWMIDQSLPFPGMGDREWGLWLELWRQAARREELRAVAARLYERYEDWFAEVVEDGIAAGEFVAGDPQAVVQRLVAAIDGVGLRVLVDDPRMGLEHARALVVEQAAAQLGTTPEAFA